MTSAEWVRAVLSWLGTYALHSTLFLGAAWLLCALRPPRVNRNRERLWKLGLVGGVLSASLQLALGAQPLLGSIDWRPSAETRLTSLPTLPADVGEARKESPRARPERAHENETIGVELAVPTETQTTAPRAGTAVAAADLAAEAPPSVPAGDDAGPSAPALHETRDAGAAGAEPRVASRSSAIAPARPAQVPEADPLSSAPAIPGASSWNLGLRKGAQSLSQGWPGLVLLGWTAIGLAGVGGILLSWSCLRRRMLGRRVLRDGPLVEMLERLRLRAGMRARVRLSVSERITTPFSTGLVTHEVCVPAAVVTALTQSQQEALLAHELAHLVRRDPAWFGAAFVIEKLFFFQPLNRLARRELSELAEVACDDWAVRWTGARLALASCLTEVAAWVVGERPPRALPMPGLAGHPSRLGRRVARLLDDRRSPAGEPRTTWWAPVSAVALVLTALAVPGVSATRAVSERGLSTAKRRLDAPPRMEPAGTPPGAGALDERAAEDAQDLGLAPADVSAVRATLELELGLLQDEIEQLNAELEVRALRERFAAALQRIDTRMAELRRQHERVRELLAALSAPNTPASDPARAADADVPIPSTLPDSSTSMGDIR